MRVLFTRFPLESAMGGAEIQTLSLMRGLEACGHEIVFLGSCPVLTRACAAHGFDVIPCDVGPPPVTKVGALSFLWRRQAMQRDMMTQIMNVRPDAVCMLSLSEKLLATAALRKSGVRVVWIEHDRVGPWLTRNPWLRSLKRAAESATIVCVSEASETLYRVMGFPPERIMAIPNGIDIERFPTSAQITRETSVLNVGCVARLSPEKGIDVLLNAAYDCPSVSLTIVGRGPQEGLLRKMIDAFDERVPGTAERMTIVPSVPDLGRFYASLDAFVLPSSDHDPFGLVAAEAMSAGVPTIVTDTCGIAGYCTHGQEVLIANAGSPTSLIACLTSLHDPALRRELRERGMRVVRRLFDEQTMVRAYEALLAVPPKNDRR